MSEQWGPDKEASGDQVCGAWLVRACLDSLTLLPVYLRCIFLLCWLLLPGLLLSLNTVSWVWFGAQQSPENVVLSKLTLLDINFGKI